MNTSPELTIVAFRLNTLLQSAEEILAALQQQGFQPEPVFWYDLAYTLPIAQREQLLASDVYQQGWVYVQNLSSMLPVVLLDPQPDEEVLDLCAAPGSKTTQLAVHMSNQGRLAAVEKIKPRFFKLLANLEQQGVTNCHTYLKDGISVGRACPNRFDRVLADVPCSSQASSAAKDYSWTPRKIKEMARKQWQLLQSGFLALKPGGLLLYSTCTFSVAENEMIVAKLLKRYAEQVTLLPIKLALENLVPGKTEHEGKPLNDMLHCTRRVQPTSSMSGFYLALIQKRETHE